MEPEIILYCFSFSPFYFNFFGGKAVNRLGINQYDGLYNNCCVNVVGVGVYLFIYYIILYYIMWLVRVLFTYYNWYSSFLRKIIGIHTSYKFSIRWPGRK